MNPTADNETAFVSELTAHQTMLGAFLRSLLPSQADVESLLQEVNVTLWNKREQFEVGSNFKAWSFKIAKFHALNERRKIQRNQWLVFDEDIIHKIAAAANSLSQSRLHEKQRALDHCLHKLNAKHRDLIQARYQQGESLQQYAQTHKQNPATLRSILRNVRIKLKNCIQLQLNQG
ncbi:sigma-70 family RNA polymerase sigma factor [Rubritalea tangerina]|uniref:Sigma-70 family RNA polymerase sigma factor n=1 Tax=Rubritalea tangerina TaxID=430798 RepID=A0ABW4ZFD1_9BACT